MEKESILSDIFEPHELIELNRQEEINELVAFHFTHKETGEKLLGLNFMQYNSIIQTHDSGGTYDNKNKIITLEAELKTLKDSNNRFYDKKIQELEFYIDLNYKALKIGIKALGIDKEKLENGFIDDVELPDF